MTLFGLGAGWLAGVALSDSFHLLTWQWALLAVIAAAAGAFHYRTRSLGLGFVFLACVLAGAGRLQAARAALASSSLSRLHDLPQPVELEGVVFAVPDRGDRSTVLLVRVETAALDGGEPQAIQGAVAVLASSETRWQYGDRVRTRGSLTAPSGVGRLSPASLARSGVASWMPRPSAVQRLQVRQGNPIAQILFAVRDRAEGAIRGLYSDPEAALLAGILLGDESRIPESTRRDFAATGTSHIVAISGFNLALLTGALVSISGRWLGARKGALASAAAIIAYTVLVGAAPPVSRAAVTALLALAARRIGRMSDGLASLALSGVALTAWNPLLLGDLGFQLSFGATLGLVLYSQRLSDWSGALLRRFAPGRFGERASGLAGDLIWSGVAAQATTLPIVIVGFRRLPWISLLANPIVLPVQPAVMSLGGLSAALGAIWEPLGRPIAWLAWAPLAFTHHAVRMFASIPSGSLPVLDVHPIWAVAYTAILLALVEMPETIRVRLRALPLPRPPLVLVWTLMVLAAGLVWKASLAMPDGRLHLRLLDTGGESVLIESPTGRFVLLGGGPSPVALTEALGEQLPVFAPRLDWVVVRSTDSQDADGLASLNRDIQIGGVLLAAPPGSGSLRPFLRDLSRLDRPAVQGAPGHRLELGGGATLSVLAVGEDGGAVLIHYRSFMLAIVPAGMTPDPPAAIPRRVTAALLPRSGDLAVNSHELLWELDPAVVLFAVEAGNRAGLPPADLLAWLEGRSTLRTDRNGWIELVTDGHTLSIESERP